MVVMPHVRADAIRLRTAHPEGFWCSTAAGGCGLRLTIVAGEVLEPHFRHLRDGVLTCLSVRDGRALERGYSHLLIQQQLQAWLIWQGYEAHLEHRFNDGTRADVHTDTRVDVHIGTHTARDIGGDDPEVRMQFSVRGGRDVTVGSHLEERGDDEAEQAFMAQRADPTRHPGLTSSSAASSGAGEPPARPEAGGSAQTLEVQLSPLPWARLLERDSGYRRHVDVVTWLFGESLGGEALGMRQHRGVSFHARTSQRATPRATPRTPLVVPAPLPAPTASTPAASALREGAPELGAPFRVQIGTRFLEHVTWHDLSDCRLQQDGMWTPARQEALALHQEAERAHHAAQEAARAAREAERVAAQQAEEALQRRLAEAAQRSRSERPVRSVRSTHAGGQSHQRPPAPRPPSARTVSGFATIHPEASDFTPTQGWDWLDQLPEHLHPAARLLTYYTARLVISGPLRLLSFDDADDVQALIPEALTQAGIIERTVYGWRRR